MMEGSGTLESQLEATKVKNEPLGNWLDVFNAAVITSCLFAAQGDRGARSAKPAEAHRGLVCGDGGTPHPRQPLHRAQHRVARTAMGPARPAGHAYAAQPRAADPSLVRHWLH